MRHYELHGPQKAAAGGFTDLFVVEYTDFDESANNTADTVNLITLEAGDVIFPELLVETETDWGLSSAATLDIQLSSTGDLLTGANLLTAGDPVYAVANSIGPTAITASETLQAELTPGDDEAVDDASAGKVLVWAKISRKADRRLISA